MYSLLTLRDVERFWSKVQKTEECWFWNGPKYRNGYGAFHKSLPGHRTKNIIAHRLAYTLVNGAIPEGLELDHLCHVRSCVNPYHLEAVTHRENVDRRTARKTHCINGHEFTPENIYWRPTGNKGRDCRTCRQLSYRKAGSEAGSE